MVSVVSWIMSWLTLKGANDGWLWCDTLMMWVRWEADDVALSFYDIFDGLDNGLLIQTTRIRHCHLCLGVEGCLQLLDVAHFGCLPLILVSCGIEEEFQGGSINAEPEWVDPGCDVESGYGLLVIAWLTIRQLYHVLAGVGGCATEALLAEDSCEARLLDVVLHDHITHSRREGVCGTDCERALGIHNAQSNIVA